MNHLFATEAARQNPFLLRDVSGKAPWDVGHAYAAYAPAPASPNQTWWKRHEKPEEPWGSGDEVVVSLQVLWGDTVLASKILRPGESFFPRSMGAASEGCLVSWKGGAPVVHVGDAPHAFSIFGEPAPEEVLVRRGLLAFKEARLEVGLSVEVLAGALTFVCSGARAERELTSPFAVDGAHALTQGISFLVHAGVLGALAFLMPRMSDEESEIDRERLLMMQKYLSAAAERERPPVQADSEVSENETPGGQAGAQHKGAEGELGDTQAPVRNTRFAVQGSRDNPNPEVLRKAMVEQAASFGVISMLMALKGPSSSFARPEAEGNSDQGAVGKMFGDTLGDARGAGGLSLSGNDEGGGGPGFGIGLNNFGSLGGCVGTACFGTGPYGAGPGGIGGGRDRGGMRSHPNTFTMRPGGSVNINGRLPAEVIQRIVRQNFGRFRMCYENGLRSNPELAGRVAVRFVIDRQGAVSLTSDGGSDLADKGVVGCVVSGFGNLSFPAPADGMVTVTYPLVFSPGT